MICLQLRRSEDDLAIHQQKIAKNACKEGRTNYFTDKKNSLIYKKSYNEMKSASLMLMQNNAVLAIL